MKHLAKSSKTKFSGLIVLFILSASSASAQNFDYALQADFVKFDIDDVSPGAKLFPKDYYNGYEIGGLIFYNPTPSHFHFYTGLSFSRFNYEYYDLSYGTLPLGLNIHIGNKAGVFLGPGIKFRLLLNDPAQSHDFSHFVYSYTAQLGVFFTIKSLRFQLYPQLEFVKTPVYIGADWRDPVDYDLYITTYNLTIFF